MTNSADKIPLVRSYHLFPATEAGQRLRVNSFTARISTSIRNESRGNGKAKRFLSPVPVTKVTARSAHFRLTIERMGMRREHRLNVPLSVRLWGLDRQGKVFSQNVKTLNIATSGARLYGVTAELEPGFIVGVQCGNMRARFMVVWVGEKGGPNESQVGLRAAKNGIWSVALPRAGEEDFAAWLAEQYQQTQL